MNNKLQLYSYWRSSCSWRVRWALAVKGIPYETLPVNLLKSEQRSDFYLRLNPSGLVPALVCGGAILGESMAIIEFLEEEYPTPSLFPGEAVDRAKIRQISYAISSGIQPIQNLKVQRFFSSDKKEQVRFAQHWIGEGFKVVEALVLANQHPYCYGENLTVADLCLIPQVFNAKRFEVDLEAFPKIVEIYENCRSLDSCKKSEPESQPDAELP